MAPFFFTSYKQIINNQQKFMHLSAHLTISHITQYLSSLSNKFYDSNSYNIINQLYIIQKKLVISFHFNFHKMAKKQSQYAGDYFPTNLSTKYSEQQIDPKRIKRMQMLTQNYMVKQQKNDEELSKAPVKFHKFREDARKIHRELAQQNHDIMKMSQTLTKSVLDNNRFELMAGGKNSKNKVAVSDLNNTNNREIPNVNLDYHIELNTALVESKIDTRQLIELYPYKKMSIEIEPNTYLKPDFEFFFFSTKNNKQQFLFNSLVQIVDEGLPSDIKQEITTLTYYMDYFDYIQFVRYMFSKPKSSETKYPPELLQLARNSLIADGSSDQQDYNKRQLVIDATNSFHRVFQCDQSQLSKPFDSIYFQDVQDYENYKRLRIVEYKNLKIESEDIVINTDVRNIISSQKIYLINIIEELELSVQLLKANKEEYLLNTLHDMMIKKIYEYLHLVCGYTTSKILIRYNIADPYTKIYEFLYKSILHGKQYQVVQPWVIQKYPVLQIWYHLPDKIFGYARQDIHLALYKLIEATIEFQKKMKEQQQYHYLKMKQYNRKYLPEADPNNKTSK